MAKLNFQKMLIFSGKKPVAQKNFMYTAGLVKIKEKISFPSGSGCTCCTLCDRIGHNRSTHSRKSEHFDGSVHQYLF
jgi:hypothetical protein